MTVPGEANWLNILQEEVSLNEADIEAFRKFNTDGSNRFWHLIVLAFRAVEYKTNHAGEVVTRTRRIEGNHLE